MNVEIGTEAGNSFSGNICFAFWYCVFAVYEDLCTWQGNLLLFSPLGELLYEFLPGQQLLPVLPAQQLYTFYSTKFSPCLLNMFLSPTLQMKDRWESNINVWFRFMHSQKWNCMALLFSNQNYNDLSSSFRIHLSVSDLYIFLGSVCLFCCSQIARLILGIYKLLTDTWM